MTVTVNLNAPTEIIFDLEIEGLATLTTLECRFCILHDISMFFPCQKVGDKQFSVKLPILSMLSKDKSYRFAVEVIADNYFFKALEDSLTVAETVSKVTATIQQPAPEQPKPTPPAPTVEPASSAEPVPAAATTEPVNTPPPKAEQIPMVFKPGKRSFTPELVSTDQPLLKSLTSDEESKEPPKEKPADVEKKDDPEMSEKPKDEKKEPPKKGGFKPFEKKKDKEQQQESVTLSEKDVKVLEILAENEKQHQQRVQAEVSQEILAMIEKREKNKRVQQILQDHQSQRGK